MPHVRKFCWIYIDKTTSVLVEVQRPRLRAANPTYLVRNGHSIDAVLYREFHNRYKFVGRRDAVAERLKSATR